MINFIKSKIIESKEKKQRKEKERLEQEEIRKEKIRIEQEKRKEEDKKREQQFNESLKNIFIDNSICISLVGINLCSMHNFIIQAMSKLNVNMNEDILYQNFIRVYKLGYEVNTISEFENKVNKNQLKSIFKSNFKKYINTNNSMYTEKICDLVFNYKLDDLILEESLYGGGETVDLAIEQVKDCLSGESDIDVGRMMIAWISLMYAVALNKLLLLLKYKKKYIQNDELYNITINLYEEIKDYRSVTEKIYPIYKEFYKDIFSDILDQRALGILANLINKENTYKNLDVEGKVLSLGEELNVFDNLEIENISYEELYKSLMVIGEYFLNDKSSIIYIYCSLIKILINRIDIKELLSMYSKLEEIKNAINERNKQIKIAKERERYLNNDFRKEKEKEEDIYDFESIKTGEEFELYLKKLFTRIGYDVETTKASGDQGADLILVKNRVKTVVQAKFYSSPVSNKAVQEVVGAIKFYNADKGMVVTNNTYTKSALELADANNIEMIDGKKLEEIRNSVFITI